MIVLYICTIETIENIEMNSKTTIFIKKPINNAMCCICS